jgi:hypothetical protein
MLYCFSWQELSWNGARLRACFLGGCGLWVLSSVGFFYLQPDWCPAIYILAAVVGVGNALMLVSGLLGLLMNAVVF